MCLGRGQSFVGGLRKERKRVKKKERQHKAQDWAADIQKEGCTPPRVLIRCLGSRASRARHILGPGEMSAKVNGRVTRG